MRILAGLGMALLLAGGLFGQHGNYINTQPVLTGGFGNVVFPGGTSATVPGLQRVTPNVVYPGGGGPRLVVPGSSKRTAGSLAPVSPVVYYPLLVGGYGYSTASPDAAPADAPPQQGNITVIYPPQPAPVIINQYGSAPPSPRAYDLPAGDQADTTADTAPEPAEDTHYLLAFKDHTIYSVSNYWVDGDTLHYFTAGNTHNQASLSLIDRELTARLNHESGVEVKLPAPRQ